MQFGRMRRENTSHPRPEPGVEREPQTVGAPLVEVGAGAPPLDCGCPLQFLLVRVGRGEVPVEPVTDLLRWSLEKMVYYICVRSRVTDRCCDSVGQRLDVLRPRTSLADWLDAR